MNCMLIRWARGQTVGGIRVTINIARVSIEKVAAASDLAENIMDLPDMIDDTCCIPKMAKF